MAGEEQRFLAGAQLRSSAALFLLHLSLQLAAPCAEDGKGVLTESSRLLGSLGAQASDTGHGAPSGVFPQHMHRSPEQPR